MGDFIPADSTSPSEEAPSTAAQSQNESKQKSASKDKSKPSNAVKSREDSPLNFAKKHSPQPAEVREIPEEKRRIYDNSDDKHTETFSDEDSTAKSRANPAQPVEARNITEVLKEGLHRIEDGAKAGVEIAKHQLDRLASSDTVSQVKEALSKTLERSVEVGHSVQQTIMTTTTAVIERASEGLSQESVTQACHTLIDRSKGLVETVTSEEFKGNVKETVAKALDSGKETVTHAVDAGAVRVVQAVTVSKEVVGNALHEAREKVSTAIELVREGEIKEKVAALVESAKDTAHRISDPEFRKNVNESLRQNLSTAKTSVVSAISSIGQTIRQSSVSEFDNSADNLTKIEPPASPSKSKQAPAPTVPEAQNDSDEEEDFGAYSKKKSITPKEKLQ